MTCETLTPEAWLAANPLADGERLYVVFGSVSEADVLAAYRRHDGFQVPLPLWKGTPYAGWLEAMPYLVEAAPQGEFFAWCGAARCRDWGWLAVSSHPPAQVFEYLRSLTQVKLPDGTAVFLRLWDGHQLLALLDHEQAGSPALLPVFSRVWSNGQARSLRQAARLNIEPFPWWPVSAELLEHLHRRDPGPVIDNLMQWLREVHPDLYFALPEATLRCKVERLALGAPLDTPAMERLLAHVNKDITP